MGEGGSLIFYPKVIFLKLFSETFNKQIQTQCIIKESAMDLKFYSHSLKTTLSMSPSKSQIVITDHYLAALNFSLLPKHNWLLHTTGLLKILFHLESLSSSLCLNSFILKRLSSNIFPS